MRICRFVLASGLVLFSAPPYAVSQAASLNFTIKEGDCLSFKHTTNQQPVQLVFLHGLMETKKLGQTFIKNKTHLENFAKSFPARVYVPLAPDRCTPQSKPGTRCWSWGFERPETLTQKFQEIVGKAKSCLIYTTPITIVGFSNGGHFLNQLLQKCILDKNYRYLSVGMGGLNLIRSKNYGACPPYNLAVGKGDKLNLEKVRKLFHDLIAQKNEASFIEFDGGHYITVKLLDKFFKQPSNSK